MPKYTLEQSSTVTDLLACSGTSQQAFAITEKTWPWCKSGVTSLRLSRQGTVLETVEWGNRHRRHVWVGSLCHLTLIFYCVIKQVLDVVFLFIDNEITTDMTTQWRQCPVIETPDYRCWHVSSLLISFLGKWNNLSSLHKCNNSIRFLVFPNNQINTAGVASSRGWANLALSVLPT